ncbi:DUF6259 domain-containing protein [Paludisphaera rhizosphaerae]|uniref:DUF6259 domain-containing protein n=1 Tax=Paludisphaera rhizosphaerae TaxID=2711216 RepID=UPI0013EA8132|nr:DUF6259 domain-containing protein [Paludisphaera rhizosphaerae]
MAYRLMLLLAMTAWEPDGESLVGYRRGPASMTGPCDRREAVEPVWVYAYPRLKLRYRASGTLGGDAAVLTLAPGSVGPVTPGATNPENPFVAGQPVVAVRSSDLKTDGESHTLEVDLRGKMRTPQIHELRYTLPEGARLDLEELTFVGGPELLPTDPPKLPSDVVAWGVEAPVAADAWRGTTMRGEETIRIVGAPRAGGAFYLTIAPHFANVREFAAGVPADKIRVKESRETADVTVRLIYKDGGWEEQYPLSIAERRHVLTNRSPALYALELDRGRPLAAVELYDRSPHVQLFVAAGGVSDAPPPTSLESLPVLKAPQKRNEAAAPAEASLSYRIAGAPEGAVAADLVESTVAGGRRATLALKNGGTKALDLTVTFPQATVQVSDDPRDVAYLFPRRGTVISTEERTLEAPYNAAFPLQFLDVFAPEANRGAAVVVCDVEGRDKTFRLKKTDAKVAAEVDHRVHLEPGESWRAPEVRIAFHSGDWREGFSAYRDWLATWYRPVGPRPAWLRSAFWTRRDYPVGGTGKLFDVKAGRYTFDALIEDGRAFGGIDFIDVSGWAMSESVGRVGDYPIELGGVADLARNIREARDRGVPTGLYFEGYLIDKRSAVGKAQEGRWQLIDQNGKGLWWAGGEATEFYACPYMPEWRSYLSRRVAQVAADVGAAGVYLDEFGFGGKRCFATTHGHPPGVDTLRGEIETAAAVRRELEASGVGETILYIEETPPDAAAPYFDAALCYALPLTDVRQSPLKLNLSRFAFPDIRLWDMVSLGIDPRAFAAEDFRLSLWHGNGLWLKGHAQTWYGEKLLAWIQKAGSLLHEHAEAFAGPAEPLVDSPHPAVFINRFGKGPKTVHTLFNASYRTARFSFEGRDFVLAPRDVAVAAPSQ